MGGERKYKNTFGFKSIFDKNFRRNIGILSDLSTYQSIHDETAHPFQDHRGGWSR